LIKQLAVGSDYEDIVCSVRQPSSTAIVWSVCLDKTRHIYCSQPLIYNIVQSHAERQDRKPTLDRQNIQSHA